MVNAGTVAHPVTQTPVVAFVTYGRAKLSNLRARPRVTAVFRSGWEWVAVEGACEIVGPDDVLAGFDPTRSARAAARHLRGGGGHPRRLGRVRSRHGQERRAAVLVFPERIYSNTPAQPA